MSPVAFLELYWSCAGLGLGNIADSVTDFLLGRPGSWLASIWCSQFTTSSCPELPSWLWSCRKVKARVTSCLQLGNPECASPSGPGHLVEDLCRCLPSALGSQTKRGTVLLKAIIKNNYSFYFTFESPFIWLSCLLIYLPTWCCLWRCLFLSSAGTQPPNLSGLQQQHTHSILAAQV